MKRFLEKLMGLAQEEALLRPPGAQDEDLFRQTCIRCRQCGQACPYQSVLVERTGVDAGLPYIEPRRMPCFLCTDFPCIGTCPTGSLQTVEDRTLVRMGIAKIDQDLCFAYNGIVCRACYERCPFYREAVILKDELYPEIVRDKCVGCGICENVCPADPKAVSVMAGEDKRPD